MNTPNAVPGDRVLIFDTTLRDGEQSPGISLNTAEKLEIAHQLARLGVDIVEAGFPIASPGDFEAVQAIAREVEGPVIAGLARAQAADIERAHQAVRDAARPRIAPGRPDAVRQGQRDRHGGDEQYKGSDRRIGECPSACFSLT